MDFHDSTPLLDHGNKEPWKSSSNWKPFSRRWEVAWLPTLAASTPLSATPPIAFLEMPLWLFWPTARVCPEELKEAVALANQFGFALEVIQTAEFDNEDYLTNPPNRCYFCKHALFESMERLASQKHFPYLVYGENADDAGDVRPGVQSEAFQVKAPLKKSA